jgi:hypothetical protein
VIGQHRLWFDLCEWEILEARRRRFHSEQSRAVLRRAAAHLDGQILKRVVLTIRPWACSFVFDGGSTLVARRYRRYRRDDGVWHLYSPRTYLGLRADGQLEFGWLHPERLERCKVSALEIAV